MFKFITQRPLWVNIIAAVALAVILFFLFIFSLKWFTHHDKSMTVPQVTGKSFESAKELLEKAGFEVAQLFRKEYPKADGSTATHLIFICRKN